jgi:hypothetical protein
MELLGCKGKKTYADCPMRKWNSSGTGAHGVNWCVGARNPCLGCVRPDFPDGMSPFYVYSPTPGEPAEPSGTPDPPGVTDDPDKKSPSPAPSRRVDGESSGHDDHH